MKNKINTTYLMKRAWRIAREAAAEFGGSVKSFFSEALKQAWAEKQLVKLTDSKKEAIEQLFCKFLDRKLSELIIERFDNVVTATIIMNGYSYSATIKKNGKIKTKRGLPVISMDRY